MTTSFLAGNVASAEEAALARADHVPMPLSSDEEGGNGCFEEDGEKVIGLREWASRQVVPLRATQHASLPDLDSMPALQLARTKPIVAANRIEIEHDGRAWRVRDWHAAAGLKQDGRPTREVSLLPGMEVSIAGRVFVAESARTIKLRNFCSRLLGWGDDRLAAVDHALRALRLSSVGRAALVLCGEQDMVAVAHSLHRHLMSDTAPFVVSVPRHGRAPVLATVRSPANFPKGIEAFRHAYRGTLCLQMSRRPPDFEEVVATFRASAGDVQLVLCATARARAEFPFVPARIDIPPLKSRPAEDVERIITEYTDDAIRLLHAPNDCVQPRDTAWLVDRAAIAGELTIPSIEKAVVRLVAVRMADTLSQAARMLGMAPASLRSWLERRSMAIDRPAEHPQEPPNAGALQAPHSPHDGR